MVQEDRTMSIHFWLYRSELQFYYIKVLASKHSYTLIISLFKIDFEMQCKIKILLVNFLYKYIRIKTDKT